MSLLLILIRDHSEAMKKHIGQEDCQIGYICSRTLIKKTLKNPQETLWELQKLFMLSSSYQG